MRTDPLGQPLPPIAIAQDDHAKLTDLALSIEDRLPAVAEALLAELDRAEIAPGDRLAAGVVRVGSTLVYRTDADGPRRVRLVWPGEADIAAGRISVLTPVGAALIGLAAGQSIAWTTRDGRVGNLVVEEVEPFGA